MSLGKDVGSYLPNDINLKSWRLNLSQGKRQEARQNISNKKLQSL
jgi:hypothetical protein